MVGELEEGIARGWVEREEVKGRARVGGTREQARQGGVGNKGAREQGRA